MARGSGPTSAPRASSPPLRTGAAHHRQVSTEPRQGRHAHWAAGAPRPRAVARHKIRGPPCCSPGSGRESTHTTRVSTRRKGHAGARGPGPLHLETRTASGCHGSPASPASPLSGCLQPHGPCLGDGRGGWCRPGLHRGVPGAQREAPAFFSHVPGPERWIPKAGSPPPNTATRCPTEAHSGPLGQPAPHPRHDRETQTPGTSSASGLPPGLTAPAETLSLPLFSPSLSLPLGPTRCHPFPGERARTEAFSPLLDPSDARSATCPHKSLSVPAGSPGTPAREH